MTDLVKIESGGVLYAIVLKRTYTAAGVNFITEPHHSQQLAYIKHNKDTLITPHFHNPVQRVISKTQEVLLIKNGKIRCDIYDNNLCHLSSYTLVSGDVVILLTGGHGFEVLEDVEMVEVKQGPYVGSRDKSHFNPSSNGNN